MIKFYARSGLIFLSFVISLAVLASSFYFEYVKGLQPCPLCLMQRLSVFLLSIISLWIFFVHSHRLKLLLILQLVVALSGLYFASRQIWLQSLPSDQVPACLPGLDVLIRYFPLRDLLHALFWGAGDCAEVSWQWLGLTIPAWAAIYFIFMTFVALILWYWQKTK